jgi:hypothetical protein
MSRTIRRVLVALALPVLLTGCFGGGGPSPSDVASASAAASAAASEPASSDAPASAAASAGPSEEDLGPFSCDLPIHVDATVGRTNILDVRTGTHDGYDRAVIEFSDGLPEIFVERATPPFFQDASGAPLAVEGSSFLRLTLRGGTKQQDDGSSSYTGPVEFESDFPTLVHFIEGGDFEAQSTWYLGMTGEACVRVTTLEGDSPRVVIDVEH